MATARAKVSFLHIGCTYCSTVLGQTYPLDEDYLLGYAQCPEIAHLGDRENQDVELLQDRLSQRITLESTAFPFLSEELSAEPDGFTVQIESRPISFHSPSHSARAPPASQAAYPANPPALPDPSSAPPPVTTVTSPSAPSAARPAFTRKARAPVPPAAQLRMDDRSVQAQADLRFGYVMLSHLETILKRFLFVDPISSAFGLRSASLQWTQTAVSLT